MDLLIAVLAIFGAIVGVMMLLGFVWLGWELMQADAAARRALPDEPPTLDVQNHVGDDRSPHYLPHLKCTFIGDTVYCSDEPREPGLLQRIMEKPSTVSADVTVGTNVQEKR